VVHQRADVGAVLDGVGEGALGDLLAELRLAGLHGLGQRVEHRGVADDLRRLPRVVPLHADFGGLEGAGLVGGCELLAHSVWPFMAFRTSLMIVSARLGG
jgi:hypothetical protein